MPSGLAARFTEHFPEVDAGSVALIWDALMQWLRIEGRQYPTRHAMPARSVDGLLSMLRSDPIAWNDLRTGWPVSLDYLFEHLLGVWSPGDDLEPLVATWSDAFCDEPPKSRTPLLFRVDADLGIRNGCDYSGYCGSGPGDGSCDPGMGIFLW